MSTIGLLSCLCTLCAQQLGLPHVERYTLSEGLSNNSVFSLVQDSLGFLWVATGDGLNRYDGNTFHAFRHTAGDSTSLIENHISSLCLGQGGTLWIGTQVKGINQYDITRDVFQAISPSFDPYQFIHPGHSLMKGQDESLIIATNLGIYQYHPLAPDTLSQALPGTSIRCLLAESDSGFWAGGGEGLFYIDAALTKAKKMFPDAGMGIIRALATDAMGTLYIGTQEGLFFISRDDPISIQQVPDASGRLRQINAICTDRNGHLWVGGDNGLVVLDRHTKRPLGAENDVLARNGLDQERVECLLVDREDNLWIGTASDGLIRLFLSAGHFPLYRPGQHLENPNPAANTIRSILVEPEGSIWVGSYGNWLYQYPGLGEATQAQEPRAYQMEDNILSAIFRDQQGTLWIGTWNNGLFYGQEQDGRLSFSQHPSWQPGGTAPVHLQSIQHLFEDPDGQLWVISNGGILRKKPEEDTFREVSAFFPQSANSINAFLEDQAGNWWVGTWNGLFQYSPSQVQLARQTDTPPPGGLIPQAIYRELPADPLALSDNRITSLISDEEGRLWVGTYGGGLHRFNEGAFQRFSEAEGLPNNIIYGIEPDSLGRLWISTNNGLALFDPLSERFRVFTEDDGLQNNQFYFGAHTRTADGRILMGGINGFNLFRPEAYSLDGPPAPGVNLTGLEIRGVPPPIGLREDGSVVLDSAILLSQRMVLQPYDNAFRLDFSALTFNHATKLQFAYRLKGVDPDWRLTDYQNRFAVYGQLYEGRYTFELKASLNGYQWGPVRQLVVEVMPPWYRTWWAYSLLGVLILGIIIAVARISYVYSNLQNKLHLAELRREKDAEIFQLRLWFFTGISHEFRTPLTLILSPLNELLHQFQLPAGVRDKLRLMQKSSQRLLRLVNQILNLRRVDAGELTLQASQQDIVSFAHHIFRSFFDHAQSRDFRYEFSASQDEISLWFDQEKMEIILYNLLSNAFKYNRPAGKVSLSILAGENEVELVVKDEGIGIATAQLSEIFQPFQRAGAERKYEGFGIGLALVKSLVELHAGRIEVESTLQEGTRFSLHLKRGKAHLKPEEVVSSPVHTRSEQAVLAAQEAALPQLDTETEFQEKPVLLLVEDEVELRRYIAGHFQAEFDIQEASQGQEALEIASRDIPDLIISDVRMPVMDGLALCQRLAEQVSTRQIPVILLTGRTALTHQMQGLQSGAIAYIPKPVDIALLRERALAVLRQVRQMQQSYQQDAILPLEPNLLSKDEKFVRKAAQIVANQMSSPTFSAQVFADEMGMGRSNLYKKLMAATDKSSTQFIRYIRLRHAEKLLLEGDHNISEAAYKVGFGDLKYFRKCFREEFGLSPSDYLRQAAAADFDDAAG